MIVGDGRPLRFLALVGGGWIGVRFLFVAIETGQMPDAVRTVVPLPVAAQARTLAPIMSSLPISGRRSRSVSARRTVIVAAKPATLAVDSPARADGASSATIAFDRESFQPTSHANLIGAMAAPTPVAAPLFLPRNFPPIPVLLGTSPVSVSSWMIVRGGTGLGASALAPQLGGTQGGVRVDYAVARGFAVTGRVAAPAAGAGRELSLGIAWRPSGVPVRIVAEQRLALDGGRSGPALGISAGVSSVRLPTGFRLDGYGQAGAIARAGIETYVDASVRAARPLTELGGIAFDLGGGAWGGAQRGVARLDVGPTLGARIPLASRSVRVALDWRQRIAGNARPGSGPALTLGSDF